MLTVLPLPVLADNYIYLLHDQDSRQTAAVDPGLAKPVLDALSLNGWQLSHILVTHHHSDHTAGISELKALTDCTVIASAMDQHRIPSVDLAVTEHDKICIGKYSAQVIATPGHTNGHIVYYFSDHNWLFSGDTLFVMGCGRLFEGTALQLWASLQKLKQLPPETQVYCAHEYTQSNGQFALTVEPDNVVLKEKMRRVDTLRTKGLTTVPSTIAEELATNPFFRENYLTVLKNNPNAGEKTAERFAYLRQLKDQFKV